MIENKFQVILKDHNLPDMDGVIDVRWIASMDDWWCRTTTGWFWLDKRTKEWKPARLGPPY